MAAYVKYVQNRVPTAVGTIAQTVIPSVDMRGHTTLTLAIDNDSLTETFNGTIEVSPDGTYPGTVLADDAFAVMAPGESRYAFVPASYLYARVKGAYVAGPDTLRVSAVLLREISRE